MPISAIDTITLAVEHTKQQLFRPFRFWQWTRLAVVGLLAGELGSGGGFNGSNFHFPRHPVTSPHFLGPGLAGIDLALLGGLIAVIVIAAFALGIILMYISSVMRFVLFDSILAKECHIGRGWSRRQGPGWRYFLWKLLYLFVTIAGLVVLVGVPAAFAFAVGWLKATKGARAPAGFRWDRSVLRIPDFLAGNIRDLCIDERFCGTTNGAGGYRRDRRLAPALADDQGRDGRYAVYIGMKILMAIGAGIVIGIATLILGLFIAIPDGRSEYSCRADREDSRAYLECLYDYAGGGSGKHSAGIFYI